MKKLTLLAFILSACSPSVPDDYSQSPEQPHIYPDYTDVTVPVNMAPLTFQLEQQADELVTRYTVGSEELVCGGQQVCPDAADWQRLAAAAVKGQPVNVEVYARRDGAWTRYQPFHIYVSPDSIDPYISYRIISPSYVTYEDLTLRQRSLENYDESIIYDNMLCSTESQGQCINCHSYQQYNPQRMQFHARQNHGGTVVAYDGTLRKLNMKNDSTISAGVYPAWHPWLRLIAYSTNTTRQSFHVNHPNKIEVFDAESDLVVFDLDRNLVANVENDPSELEVFPFWAPDGRALYYCSAHFEQPDSTVDKGYNVLSHAADMKYCIYRKSFDPSTLQFGPREMVFDAAHVDSLYNGSGASATLPRISPDGRYLLFTLAEYGVFHIWHRDADLWLLDLTTGEARPMREVNSAETESYHAWSSNGRWIVFSSRRDDGNFTRPFFAHIDRDGHATKPFELPMADPDHHRQFMRCYNIPEFMRGPVEVTPQEFARVLKSDGEPRASYAPHL